MSQGTQPGARDRPDQADDDAALGLSGAAARRLRWRCRRGVLELDLVLQTFLERRYPVLAAAERAAFHRLLQRPDAVLLSWINGLAEPETDLKGIVKRIRQLSDFRNK